MKVSFLSMDDQKNKVYFVADASFKENVLSFVDKSCEHTQITMTLEEDRITLARTGLVQMEMIFELEHFTPGAYQNEEGLEFTFKIFCKRLSIQKKRMIIQYDMLLDQQILSSHTLSVTILDK